MHDGSDGTESACSVDDLGLIPRLARSSGEGNSYSLQYSCLENSMDCIVHKVAKSWTQLSNFHFHFSLSMISPSLDFKFLEGRDCLSLYILEYLVLYGLPDT